MPALNHSPFEAASVLPVSVYLTLSDIRDGDGDADGDGESSSTNRFHISDNQRLQWRSEDGQTVLVDATFDRVFDQRRHCQGPSGDDDHGNDPSGSVLYRETLGRKHDTTGTASPALATVETASANAEPSGGVCSCPDLAGRLCSGYHCTIVTCGVVVAATSASAQGTDGPKGDGGSRRSVEATTSACEWLGTRSAVGVDRSDSASTISVGDNETQANLADEELPTGGRDRGLLPRLAEDVFQHLRAGNSPGDPVPTVTECTIRCSVVEVRRDRIRDLLHEASTVRVDTNSGALTGCAAYSCVSPGDVTRVVHRAESVRACTRLFQDERDRGGSDTASTLVIQITLEQYRSTTEESLQSRLLLVDLGIADGDGAVLHNILPTIQQHARDTVERQTQQPSSIGFSPVNPLDPTLWQILSPSLGGNVYTSLFLHVIEDDRDPGASSPVLESMLRFGVECSRIRNRPVPHRVDDRWQSTHERVESLQYRLDCYQHLTQALADECHRLRNRPGGSANHLVDKKLWSFIEEIQSRASSSPNSHQGLYFSSETREEQQVRRDLMKLRSGLRRTERERDEAISVMRQLESDLAVVSEELSSLRELHEAQPSVEEVQAENRALQQTNQELLSRLRTSLFRESEAVVFLRQYRKFYTRLLRQQAAKGSGPIVDVIRSVPGAPPDLDQLHDLDRIMVESGLLEAEEVGVDTPVKHHRPSREALLRSTALAAQAVKTMEEQDQCSGFAHSTCLGVIDVPLSIVARHETGEATDTRQKLLQTPSGRYVALRENLLEKEILELSEYCSRLESQLSDERAVTASLKAERADEVAAAIEIQALRQALEKRDKDINAVIWKMNELHVSGKAFQERCELREPHIAYLEGMLAKVECDYRQCSTERSVLETKYRNEISKLRFKLRSVAGPTWHVIGSSKLLPSLESRLVIPFSADANFASTIQRKSSAEDALDCFFRARNIESIDAETQTDLFEIESMPSCDADATRSAAGAVITGVSRKSSSLSPDDFLFMNEDSFTNADEGQNIYEMLDDYDVGRKQDEQFSRNAGKPGTRPSAMRQGASSSSGSLSQSLHGSTSSSGAPAARNLSMTRSISLKDLAINANHTPCTSELMMSQVSHQRRRFSMRGGGQRMDQNRSSHDVDVASTSAALQKLNTSHSSVKGALPGWREHDAIVEKMTHRSVPSVPQRTDHIVSTLPSQSSQQGDAPSLSTFMDKLRKKSSGPQPEDDEQSNTPEFMKLFKKIGFKKSEEVIETQGAAAVRELTRTAYGEHAVTTIRNEKGVADPSVLPMSSMTKKWVPRKKKSDDSDSDDSFAKQFLGVGVCESDSESESGANDDTTSLQIKQRGAIVPQYESDDESDSVHPEPQLEESASPCKNLSKSTSTRDDEDEKPKTPPWKKKDAAPPPLPQAIGSPWRKASGVSGSTWKSASISGPVKVSIPAAPRVASDDDSNSDSEGKKPATGPTVPVADSPQIARDNEESDSEDEKPKTPPWKKKNAAAPAPQAPAFLSKQKQDGEGINAKFSGSKISELNSVSSTSKTPKAQTPATSDSESSDDEARGNESKFQPARPAPGVILARQRLDSDSLNNYEPENESRPVRPPVQPPSKKATANDEDSSDYDSSDEESCYKPAKPQPSVKTLPPQLQRTSEATQSDDSDEESSDQDTPMIVPSTTSTAPKISVESSDDEDENSDDEAATKISSNNGTGSSPVSLTMIKSGRPSNSYDSSDEKDDDSSSDEENVKSVPPPRSTVVASTPSLPSVEKEDSSEETDDDSVDNPAVQSCVNPIPEPSGKTIYKPATKDDSDESESSNDEKPRPVSQPVKPIAQPVQQVAQPAKKLDPDSESDDSSDDDDSPIKVMPRRRVEPAKRPANDSDDDDEPPKPSPPAMPKAPPSQYKPSPPATEYESDEDDSDDKVPSTSHRADPPTQTALPKVTYDEGSDDGSSAEDDDKGEEEDDGFILPTGKASGFEPTRQVPDFGAQVTPSVTHAANHMGGWSDSKKEKAKFVIRNGQLVKSGATCDSSEVSEESGMTSGSASLRGTPPPPTRKPRRNSALATTSSSTPTTPSGKTKFVIRDGKLVRDDSVGALSRSSSSSSSPPPERKALKMEPSSPRKKGKSSSNPDGSSKVPATATFVIKDGKLVKSPGTSLVAGMAVPSSAAPSLNGGGKASAAPSSTTTKAPAFSIVNGKLVKVGADGESSGPRSSKPSKKSDKKDKKEKDKKKSKKKSKEKN